MSDLKKAIGGDDKDIIDKKAAALAEASAALAQQAYAQANAGASAEGAAGAGQGGAKQDDVLDAEFEEVKDKK